MTVEKMEIKMSVFISWAGADREVKNVIAEKLRGENIPYFDSDEHCVSNFSEECIRNIRRSTVFIVIVSEASMDPHSYVRNEIIEARRMENDGHLNILVYKITDEPYTEFFSFNLNHISDANHVARIQKAGGGIDTLIKRVKHLIALRDAGTPEKPHDVLYPRIVGTPVSTSAYVGYFVDESRDGLLSELKDAFAESNVVILSELFGFGKKSVIRKFAALGGFNVAIELDGMHDTLFEFFFGDLRFSNVSDAAFATGDARAAIKRKFELLSHLDEKHLIIISDVDIESEPDEEIMKQLRALRCRVAIITQNSAEAYLDYMPVFSVGRMQSEHLAKLFFHYFDRSGSTDREALMPTLDSFFDGIGGHTKTVEIAASVLSKELVADVEEVKRFLSSSEDGRDLVDRIIERLARLIDLEHFDKDEEDTLLITALLAAPQVSLDDLFEIARAAEVNARLALGALAERRWITVNTKAKTVYIEPIIARICAVRLEQDQAVLDACLDYLIKACVNVSLKDTNALMKFCARTEHFLNAVSLPEIAELARTLKPREFSSSDVIDGVIERFLGWFYDFRERYDADRERDVFTMQVAAWAIFYIAPALEAYQRMPMLFSFDKSSINVGDIMNSRVAELLSLQCDPIIADCCERLVGDLDSLAGDMTEIHSMFMESFSEKDFGKMDEALERLIGKMSDPDAVEDDDNAQIAVTIVKVFASFCIATGAYKTGMSLVEKLIYLDFKPSAAHELIMIYLSLIVASGDTSIDLFEILETSEELLQDAAASGALVGDALGLEKRLQLAYTVYAMIDAGEREEAAGLLEELLSLGTDGVLQLAGSAASDLVDAWLVDGEKDRAIEFISRHEKFFATLAESADISDRCKENAIASLSLLELSDEIGSDTVDRGGVIEDQSYYQKYSREKKNGLFKMMAYNKCADAVKRFDFSGIDNSEFKEHAARLRARAESGEPKLKLAPEAFALVSEAGFRTLGYRHHYVQYVGAAVMLDGKIAEILNGEGKTYTIPLVAFVNSLYSDKVFVLDESLYLTERNYKWMRGLYTLLGISVGHIRPQNQWSYPIDSEDATVYYCSLRALAIAVMHREINCPEKRHLLSSASVIVDEADMLLVERASAPLTYVDESKSSPEHKELCARIYEFAESIFGDGTYYYAEKSYPVLTGECNALIESSFGIEYGSLNRTESLLKIESLIKLALYTMKLVRGKDYFIADGIVKEEYRSTGEAYVTEGEKAYFIARREGLPLEKYENALAKTKSTVNKIYLYGLLKRFGTISGTSATASSFKKEFKELYGLEVLSVPPVLPIKRVDKTVTLYMDPEKRDGDICRLVYEKHLTGQPILLVTGSVRESERYSEMLTGYGIEHKLLNAVNSESSPEMIASAGVFGSVLVSTQLANRGVDIKLGGDPERMTLFELCEAGYDLSGIDEILYTVPTDEVRESELYKKYSATLEKNRAQATLDREAVIKAGGLCVIGTEPSANLRVEQQMRGRAGRQGAVGESYVFECIEDEFFELLLSPKFKSLMINIAGGVDIIESKMLTRSVDKAQENVHHTTFGKMTRAAELSSRLEHTKDTVFNYMQTNYSLETVCELLSIWSDSYNVQSAAAKDINEGSSRKRSAGGYFAYRYPEIFNFEGEEQPLDQLLYDAAASYVIDRELYGEHTYLVDHMRSALKTHLTAIGELEEYYSWQLTVYSDKFLAEQYEDNCAECIASAVESWLFASIKRLEGRPVRKAEPPKPFVTVGRNDICPCGSGKKYKACCGKLSGEGGTEE